MINAVYDTLRDLGMLHRGARPPCNIRLLRNVNVTVFCDRQHFYHVKVGDLSSVAEEYRAMRQAWAVMPDFVSEPLGLERRNGHEVLVTRGKDHLPLDPMALCRPRLQVVADLVRYLETTRHAFAVPSDGAAEDELIDHALAGQRLGFQPRLRRWLAEGGREELLRLPRVKQHGDFLSPNLGLCGRHLAIFDWEDFGKVTLSGFDVCMVLLWSLRFSAETAVDAFYGGAAFPARPLLDRYCELYDVEHAAFADAVPLYCAVFLYLKERYGYRPEIKSQIIGFIERYQAAQARRLPSRA